MFRAAMQARDGTYSFEWQRAIEDVVAFTCSKFISKTYDPNPQEIRQALEEVLDSAKETFDVLGHFCSNEQCRCRAHTIVSTRAFVEARILGISSFEAQIYAMERLNDFLDGRN